MFWFLLLKSFGESKTFYEAQNKRRDEQKMELG